MSVVGLRLLGSRDDVAVVVGAGRCWPLAATVG